MENNDNILERNARHTGMTVPDGYFGDFAAQMEASLPRQPWEDEAAATPAVKVRPNLWMRLRPYVYMAAMFAGVWCMMHIFGRISSNPADLSVGGNEVLTAAVSNDDFMNLYFIDDLDQSDVYDEMYSDGVDPAEYSVSTTLSSESL